MNPIQTAISLHGTVTNFAGVLGVSIQAVCFWRDGKRTIPADKCPLIESLTNGAVRCEDMRPDVDWGFIRATAKRTPAPPVPAMACPPDIEVLTTKAA